MATSSASVIALAYEPDQRKTARCPPRVRKRPDSVESGPDAGRPPDPYYSPPVMDRLLVARRSSITQVAPRPSAGRRAVDERSGNGMALELAALPDPGAAAAAVT
ncbi:hypothetical protein JCM9533A_49790 [Catenuloplanes niger JCM 9533]